MQCISASPAITTPNLAVSLEFYVKHPRARLALDRGRFTSLSFLIGVKQ